MILLKDIDFAYPNSDFRLRVNMLNFRSGSRTAVIGPSGFGKTTLLNLISGISMPQEGTVTVNDQTVHAMSDKDRRTFRLTQIGFIFQDFKLLEYLKVMDNILLPYRINNALNISASIRSRAGEIASMLSIEQKLDKFPDKLSQGEKQRVAICRALLNDPSIILADEPTGNLDPENKQIIMRMLFDYVMDKGATLVTVTHDHELLKDFDEVVDFKDLYKS